MAAGVSSLQLVAMTYNVAHMLIRIRSLMDRIYRTVRTITLGEDESIQTACEELMHSFLEVLCICRKGIVPGLDLDF